MVPSMVTFLVYPAPTLALLAGSTGNRGARARGKAGYIPPGILATVFPVAPSRGPRHDLADLYIPGTNCLVAASRTSCEDGRW